MNEITLYKLLQERNIFLSGGAGVGKSYLTSKIIDIFQDNAKNVVPLGSTGISAVNIGGYTLHSFFIFGIASNLDELRNQDKKNSSRINELKKILKEVDLIIIDEISMVSARLMDMIYYRLDSLGYSGKLMVVGDFYQLPPITKQNSNSLFKDEIFAFESSAWGRFNFKSVILEEVKRTSDKEFIKILSKIRKGICDKDVKKYLSNLRDNKIVDEIEPTYLFARNLEVESMNMQKLSKLQTQEALFFWDIEKLKDIDDRKISSWSKALPVVERLHLKIGAPIIFTVNKWGAFVNGQRGVVVGFNDDSIIVRSKGKDIKVSEHDFELLELDSNTLEPKAVATLSQFPIKLAYAITIHKSQGMSLESLICNLDYLFAPSQLYVAISRAVEPKLLSIEYSRSDFNSYLSRAIRPNEIVDNFYEELENEN